jgi:L,D-transpeptidase YcbB
MMMRRSLARSVALTLSALIGFAGLAAGQAQAQKSARALGLDAGPSVDDTPDPLTPPEKNGPAPVAPGAPTATSETSPVDAVDPIVAAVRQRLATPLAHGGAGERDDRAGLAAFYAGGNGQPVWTSKDGFTPKAQLALEEIRRADDWGLRASAFDLPAAPGPSAATEALADAEIALGLAVLKYGRHARGGRVEPSSISRMFDQKPTIYDPKTLMQAVAASSAVDAYLRDLHPKHAQFHRLREALLAARGIKPDQEVVAPAARIPAGPKIKPGQEHAHVALVRQRLGGASETGEATLYDDALVEAVKAYQRQHNVEPTGFIDTATRNALNGVAKATAGENVQRLIVNMERWRWLPPDLGAFYVWDSVPEQMTAVYDSGKRVLFERIVVGKSDTPTPIFSADMQFVIFHPSWGVPPGMKANELWPQLRKSGSGWFFSGPTASAVLGGHGLQVSRGGHPVDPDQIDWQNTDIQSFDFTQPPGPKNVLGAVKFRFPNRHDVYMHDTPERHLFGGAVRAFSHGCMRVQNPIKLAEVLLAHDKGWSSDKVQQYAQRGGEIKLDTPIPVHISYFTAVADDNGKVSYFGDIYGLDSRLAGALTGQAVRLAGASVTTSSIAGAADSGSDPPNRKRSQRARQKPVAATTTSFNPFTW